MLHTVFVTRYTLARYSFILFAEFSIVLGALTYWLSIIMPLS